MVADTKEAHYQFLENKDTSKGVYYFNNFFNKTTKTWFHHVNYSRRHIVTLIRLRTNHHSLYESLHRKSIVESPMCSCESAWETIDHFLFE